MTAEDHFRIDGENLQPVRIYNGEKPPFEQGSLEREAFDYLSPWDEYSSDGSDMVLYHRYGRKDVDLEGARTLCYLVFSIIWHPVIVPRDSPEVDVLTEELHNMMLEYTHGPVVGYRQVVVSTAEKLSGYMIEELEKINPELNLEDDG